MAVHSAPAAAPAPAQHPPPHAGAAPWQWGLLLVAPHRLGFFVAMLVLAAASLWWLLVQADRISGSALGLAYAVPPTLTHAAVMVFGFMPLFFSGFLFTAGPRWLGVAPHPPRAVAPGVLLQTAGWLLWLAGAHTHALLAWSGLALATLGLGCMVWQFWQLIGISQAPDQVHARCVGLAGVAGVASLAGVLVSAALNNPALALVWVRVGLWGFVVVTYVAVAHRMIPFFTANVLPMQAVWRPFWVLWLMLGAAALQALDAWVQWLAPPAAAAAAWAWLLAVLELALGGTLLWLAVVWGLVQSLRVRLLAMLHVGFVWLGLALVYGGVARLIEQLGGQAWLGLGALHALGMGFLGSVMLAMVTRVSCGHSGRALVADGPVWGLFCLLQVTVVLRLAAAVQGASLWLMLGAALLWAAIMLLWCARYVGWYGRPRFDGKPG